MALDKTKKHKEFEVRLKVSNQIKLDPIEPVPVTYNGDSFRYVRNRKYIPFLGPNDNFGNTLLEARLTSTTQNACIGSIAQSLVGKGLAVKDLETPNAVWLDWMKSVNNRKQSLDKVLVKIIDGFNTQGNQFIEISRGVILGKKFLKVNLHSMLNCRLESPDVQADDDEPKNVLISKIFSKKGYVQNLPKDLPSIPLWSPLQLDQQDVWKNVGKGVEKSMIHFKNEIGGIDYYGLPPSIASLRYQILEAKAAQFNIDNFDNNMILGGILIFKSGMTQEEAEEQAREILLSHIGDGKTGRIAVVASEAGLKEVEFIPFNTQKEGSYIDYDKRIEEKIIAANAWDSVLAGINRSSTFGNGSQYIRSIWDVKDAVLLHPLREALIDDVIKPIMQIWADWFDVKEVLGYEYKLQTNMPFSFMGDLDPNTFFQVNEARVKAGLLFDEAKDGVYLSEMGGKSVNVDQQQAVNPSPEKPAK